MAEGKLSSAFRSSRSASSGDSSDVASFMKTARQLVEKQVLSSEVLDLIVQELTGSEARGKYALEFTCMRTLGRGADGTVYLCENKFDTELYALKKIPMRGSHNIDFLMKEARTLSRINHKNIVKYFASWWEKDAVYIQMEYCPPSTLKDILDKKLELPPHTFDQLVSAVAYLHGKNILHRDIAPKNIFFDKYQNLKLGDFGLAKRKSSSSSGGGGGKVGTGLYSSPQQIDNDLSSDVFSLGIILFELHYTFLDEGERVTLLTLVKHGRLDDLPNSWEANNPRLASLIRLLTHPVRAMRPRAEDISDMLVDS